MDWVHPFEKSGLGKAPFKLRCVLSFPSSSMREQNPQAYNFIMNDVLLAGKGLGVRLGTCYHCGMALMNNYVIEDCEKKCAVIGCDCAMKIGAQDRALVKEVKEAEKKRKIARKAIIKRLTKQEARRKFLAENRPTMELAWRHRGNKFIRSLLWQFLTYGKLSERQLKAVPTSIEREEANKKYQEEEAKRKAAAQHAGNIGERIERELTAIFRYQIDTAFGPSAITILRDVSGNTFKTYGVCRLEKGKTKKFKFTVKAHQEYKGEKQTLINRLAEVKA